MKKIILVLIITLSFTTLKAQYKTPKGWKSPELYIPVLSLTSTFVINDYMMNNKIGTKKETAQIAITGMAISVASHFLFKAIRERKAKSIYFY